VLDTKNGSPLVVGGSLEEAAQFVRGGGPGALERFVNWARKHSLWPIPFGTACCAIEFMGAVGSTYDLSRFGAEFVRFSPRQCDLMIVAGTVVNKMAGVLQTIYDQMAEPKWVIAMGACASTGGMFNTYSVLQGIDRIVPVDFYVPGCPPRPEMLLDAIIKLQARISKETAVLSSRERHRQFWVRGLYGRGETPKSRLLRGATEEKA